MYAIVENNIVTDTLRVEPSSIYPAPYAELFIEVPDGVERGWIWDGENYAPPPETPKTSTQIQSEIVASTQQRLDTFAQTRNYDSILSACTYATDTNPKFSAEGQYCVGARGATWTKLAEMLAEVEAGTRPMPTGYADIESELPPLVWPTQSE
jgi:hypothetical protein